MADEFSESDVVFSDNNDHHLKNIDELVESQKQENNSQEAAEKKKVVMKSVPVTIPEGMFRNWHSSEEEEDEEEIVPPHLIIAQRIAAKMTLSVFTGNGRTLKGRDLYRVRNSVLRMTGFIEV